MKMTTCAVIHKDMDFFSCWTKFFPKHCQVCCWVCWISSLNSFWSGCITDPITFSDQIYLKVSTVDTVQLYKTCFRRFLCKWHYQDRQMNALCWELQPVTVSSSSLHLKAEVALCCRSGRSKQLPWVWRAHAASGATTAKMSLIS